VSGPGQPVGDAVLSADPVEEHLTCARVTEASGELFAIVGQHFVRDPVVGQRCGERLTDRASGGSWHDRGDHAEPGMIIDPGDDLAFGAIAKQHSTDDVQLPQLHRCRA
jgi:hypothetical protein